MIMKNFRLTLAVMFLALCLQATAAEAPTRPKITGVAYYSVFVSHLEKARRFYQEFLGYEEAFHLTKPDGSVRKAVLKVNDKQFIVLVNEPNRGEGQLDHYALQTNSAEQMRTYLASRGVKVPERSGRDEFGNEMIEVTDPEGHRVRFVEYLPDSKTSAGTGKHLSPTRISEAMLHVGILIGDLDAATAFYGGILGCREVWRGNGPDSKTLNWVNMQVPDGENHVEFMLYGKLPPPNERGGQHHFCLGVHDAPQSLIQLEACPARKNYPREMKIHFGVDNKRQISLRDPDGTRIEVMDINTIDGKPAPSSKLLPPRPASATSSLESSGKP